MAESLRSPRRSLYKLVGSPPWKETFRQVGVGFAPWSLSQSVLATAVFPAFALALLGGAGAGALLVCGSGPQTQAS